MKSDTKKALQEFRAKKAELDEKIREASKKLFGEASAELFDKHPTMESFGWTQYTPNFNDGDTCTFSAHTCEPYINDDRDWSRFTSKTYYGGRVNHDYDAVKERMYEDVRKFLADFDDDDLEDMFGDHCKVTVTRKGVTTEDYDHE
jgi:hypothetical protein